MEVEAATNELSLAIFSGDIPTASVERIGELVGEVACDANPDVARECRFYLVRLRRRLERSGRIDPALHGALRCSISFLGASISIYERIQSSQTAINRRKTLQSRILDVLVEGSADPPLWPWS